MAVGASRVSAWWRRFAARSAAAILAAVAALILAEFLLPHLVTLERATLQYDALLGFRGRPHLNIPWTREMEGGQRRVRTNRLGFHDRERAMIPSAGSYRLLFLGDSFLEAYQAEIEENLPQRVARTLSQRGRGRVEALNWGVHGYGLGSHFLNVRERVDAWKPDTVVLVLFLGNDLQDNYAPLASASVPRFELMGDSLVYSPAPPYTLRYWLRDNVLARSATARLVWMYGVKTRPGIAALAREAGMIASPEDRATDDHLQGMTAVAERLFSGIAGHLRQRRIGLFVYLIPDPLLIRDVIDIRRYRRDPGAPRPVFRRDKELIEARVLAALARLQIEHVYPRELFIEHIEEGREIYRGGYGHFTALGHELSAQDLAGRLARSLDARAAGEAAGTR